MIFVVLIPGSPQMAPALAFSGVLLDVLKLTLGTMAFAVLPLFLVLLGFSSIQIVRSLSPCGTGQ